MAREKLGAFLSGPPQYGFTADQTRIAYTPSDVVEGDLGIDPRSTKELIGFSEGGEIEGQPGNSLINDFLHYITHDARNYYEIKGGAIPAPGLAHITPDGIPRAAKSAESANGDNVFVKTDGSDLDGLGASMSRYSNSGYFQNTTDENTLGKIITKYNNLTPEEDTGPGPHTGNKLLTSIVGNEPNSSDATFIDAQVDDATQNSIIEVQTMLGVNNRFNTENSRAYAPFDASNLDSAIEDGTDEIGTRTAQSKFGIFDKDAPIMKNSELVNVARSMMLKSLGLDYTSEPGNAKDPNSDGSYDADFVSSIGATQLGYMPNKNKNPSAKESKGAPTNPGLNSSPFDGGAFETGGKRSSYGSSYDSHLQYNKFSNNTIKLRAAAVVIAMVYAAKSVKDDLTFSSYTSSDIDLNRARGIPGQSIRFAADAKTQMFNRYVIPQTRFPLDDCLNAGTQLLFNISFEDIDETSAVTKKEDVQSYKNVNESAGFWYSVGRTILQRFEERSGAIDEAVEEYTSDPNSTGVAIFGLLSRTGIVGIINTIAQIGDKVLYSTGGVKVSESPGNVPRPWNVDNLPDSGQTRQSKSRSQTGLTENSLAWRGSTAPSMYLLPRNVVRAAVEMGAMAYGANPVKAHTATPIIEKSYIDINGFNIGGGEAKTTRSRIPTDVRRMIENDLDAEYVPFYFHDIRTNEIIGFHAFLNSLSDTYSPSFTSTSGYGRIEPVFTYKDTKRSLSFSFYVAATSKEDFDEMWFKINKLTSMVYPSWTSGTRMFDVKSNVITQPFSQKIGATPLIRLRIGDVVKSNYSRFNLSRLFGVGDDLGFRISDDTFTGANASGLLNMDTGWKGKLRKALTDFQVDYVFNLMFGSPLTFLGTGAAGEGNLMRLGRGLMSQGMRALGGNALINPVGAIMILPHFANPDGTISTPMESGNVVSDWLEKQSRNLRDGDSDEKGGYVKSSGGLKGSLPILKPSNDIGYYLVQTSGGDITTTRIRTTIPYRVKVMDKRVVCIDSIKLGDSDPGSYEGGTSDRNLSRTKIQYDVQLFDMDAPNLGSHFIRVWHEDLMPNPDKLFMNNVAPFLDVLGWAAGMLQEVIYQQGAAKLGVPADTLNLTTTNAQEFMHPVNNSITRAFEESGGRGLAGVIQSLSYDWLDASSTWEVDWGSRAPKVAKVTVSFDVIHDIPPGLDHGGYNRGQSYNVGSINNAAMGDADSDHGIGSKSAYKRAGLAGVQKLKKE